MKFCRESGIPCFNFQYAKAEFMENLDGYYYDLYHMNGTGADLFSEAFSRFSTPMRRRGRQRLVLRKQRGTIWRPSTASPMSG